MKFEEAERLAKQGVKFTHWLFEEYVYLGISRLGELTWYDQDDEAVCVRGADADLEIHSYPTFAEILNYVTPPCVLRRKDWPKEKGIDILDNNVVQPFCYLNSYDVKNHDITIDDLKTPDWTIDRK